MIVLVYLVCLLAILYYLYTKNYNYWKSKGFPFLKPSFPFGNLYNVAVRRQHISEFFQEIYLKTKTPCVGIYILNQPALVIKDPEYLKKVLVKDFDKFPNRTVASNESVDPLAFHTLFSSKDATWRGLRGKLSPVFTSGKIKLMLPLMKECASDLIAYLEQRNGQNFQVQEILKRYSVDIISSCAFGIKSNCLKLEQSEIKDMATRLLDFRSIYRNFCLFSYFFAPKLVDIFRLTFADRTASKFLINVFNTTFRERKEKNIVRNDFVDLLHSLQSNENFRDTYKFDDMKIASQAVSFFAAGNDTTTLTLLFAFYEVAVNPRIQDQLRKEAQAAFVNEDISYESIQGLKFLDAVVKETLRKYPLTTFINREANVDYTFEDTGLKIEKGMSIYVPVSGLHYDPEYFAEPEKFIPERFLEGNVKPYSYMPFGEGPRICIGERFAYLAVKVALCYVIKNFLIEPTKHTPSKLQLNTSSIFFQIKNVLYLRTRKLNKS